jgi:AcrR family transcriptional regulator
LLDKLYSIKYNDYIDQFGKYSQNRWSINMAPKIISEQDKNFQREKLISKGMELINIYGIRKTSVEDITTAAGMSKGSFYLNFESKEALFLEILNRFHNEWFTSAEKLLKDTPSELLRTKIKFFISNVFKSSDYLIIFKYHDEIMDLIKHAAINSHYALQNLLDMENKAYTHLIKLCGKDVSKVKPGVVYNYMHLLYFAVANRDIIEEEHKSETFEAALEGLLKYIFGEKL